MGKDNEGVKMAPMIVHVECYVISKGWKKKWGRDRHMCNVQDDPSVTDHLDIISRSHPWHCNIELPMSEHRCPKIQFNILHTVHLQ